MIGTSLIVGGLLSAPTHAVATGGLIVISAVGASLIGIASLEEYGGVSVNPLIIKGVLFLVALIGLGYGIAQIGSVMYLF